MSAVRADCPACGRSIAVRDGARLALHGPRAARCPGSGAAPAPPEAAGLVESVKARLADLERRTPGLGTGWQAALAIELAEEVIRDSVDTISARTSAAKQLREIMADLEASAPEEKTADPLDEIAERRAQRTKAAAS